MPIHIDDFEDAGPPDDETNAEAVLRFLLGHRDKAFKASEIADGAGIHENSIHPVLGRLEEQGLIRHKRPYWALGDLETVQSALAYHETAAFLNEVLGPERREEWLAAGDDRGHE